MVADLVQGLNDFISLVSGNSLLDDPKDIVLFIIYQLFHLTRFSGHFYTPRFLSDTLILIPFPQTFA
jgi:hypothetical protein